MPRESWEELDFSKGDQVDHSAGEARAPGPVVQDRQVQARSKRKVRTGVIIPPWVEGRVEDSMWKKRE